METHQLFGHTARVFVSRVISYDNRILFLSAGEDSNLCVWSDKGELLSKKNVSASGGIWNLDYGTRKIVTCSSTGKLNKFHLDELLYEEHKQMKISNDSQIIPAKLKYLDNSALVVLDNKMEIHMMLPTKDWIKVEASEKQNYVAIEVFKNRLFLAGKSSITVFDFSEKLATLQQTTNIQIEAMLPVAISLDYLRAIHAVSREVVVVSDASGLCIVVNVAENKILNILQIPKSAEPWTTAVRRYD